jgi:hypothetical protein
MSLPFQQQGELALLHDGIDDQVSRLANLDRRGTRALLSGIIRTGERAIEQAEQKQMPGAEQNNLLAQATQVAQAASSFILKRS